MKMTLNTLNIEHFKGIKQFGIAPNGANLSITGRNKQGKTTIYDAFLWLLFGKNSAGETKFTVKPTNEPTETENYVEARFDVDGKPLTLKKVYASKYIKTTGEYKGSELEYYINGVPKKKNEYETAIAEIIDEEQFKLLTNPKHFTEVLDWKKRREILFSLAETKSDSELATENPDFTEIHTELETMGNASELLKAVSAQVKKNSERINVLPKLINENTTKLSQVSAVSESDLAARNSAIKATVAANNETIGGLKAWKPTERADYGQSVRRFGRVSSCCGNVWDNARVGKRDRPVLRAGHDKAFPEHEAFGGHYKNKRWVDTARKYNHVRQSLSGSIGGGKPCGTGRKPFIAFSRSDTNF